MLSQHVEGFEGFNLAEMPRGQKQVLMSLASPPFPLSPEAEHCRALMEAAVSAWLCLSVPCRFGVRFPCMSDAYDQDLLSLAMESAQELGFLGFTRDGVYCMMAGPCYETIAECRMLQALGADAVGELRGPGLWGQLGA